LRSTSESDLIVCGYGSGERQNCWYASHACTIDQGYYEAPIPPKPDILINQDWAEMHSPPLKTGIQLMERPVVSIPQSEKQYSKSEIPKLTQDVLQVLRFIVVTVMAGATNVPAVSVSMVPSAVQSA